MKHGKKYEAALKLIDKTKAYTIEEACEFRRHHDCLLEGDPGFSFC